MEDIVQIDNNQIAIKEAFTKIASTTSRLRKTKTHRTKVSERQGSGNKIWKYVKGTEFLLWLDTNYPGWSFDVIPGTYNDRGGYVSIAGTLTVFDSNTGLKRTMTCYGAKEAILRKEDGSLVAHPYAKSAETDALKRCVIKLGGFNDVYTDVELEEAALITESQWDWYWNNIVPKLNMTGSKIINQILKLNSGVITISELEERYK